LLVLSPSDDMGHLPAEQLRRYHYYTSSLPPSGTDPSSMPIMPAGMGSSHHAAFLDFPEERLAEALAKVPVHLKEGPFKRLLKGMEAEVRATSCLELYRGVQRCV
jgi:hypothetical protein